jgi:hypothetical protein
MKVSIKTITISIISAEISELQKTLKKKLFQQIIFSKNMPKFTKAAFSIYIWVASELLH